MSPNEIKPNDIVIKCSVNDKNEINFSNPTNDKKISGFSCKKCISFGIIIIIILVIIGIVFSIIITPMCGGYLNKKNNCHCPGENCPCEGEYCPCEGDNCPCKGEDCRNYKKNDIYVYSETQSKISIIEFNDNVPLKTRRLDDFSQKKEIIFTKSKKIKHFLIINYLP